MKQKSVLFIICVFLAAAFSFAGSSGDLLGNSITNDIVSPAGGKSMLDSLSDRINASIGQCSAGFSTNPSGAKLYHGAHKPMLPENNPVLWMLY